MQASAPRRCLPPFSLGAGALALTALLTACGGGSAEDPDALGDGNQPNVVCDLDTPAGVTALVASEHGLAIASGGDGQLRVQRLEGRGCDLTSDGSPVAASELLDMDDAGNLYVFPAAAGAPDELSTWLEDGGADSVVERVDRHGKVSAMVHAGRGIWAFRMAPEGGTFLVTACGPTGIFAGQEPNFTTVLTPPDTLWNSMPSALTDAQTLWSVGYLTCNPTAATDPACGYALTRTTPEGSEELGTTLVDFGEGYEQGALTRCGRGACGLFPSGVVRWDERGAPERRFVAADLGAVPGGQILGVTGNGAGLYFLVQDASEKRVVYVPTWTTTP